MMTLIVAMYRREHVNAEVRDMLHLFDQYILNLVTSTDLHSIWRLCSRNASMVKQDFLLCPTVQDACESE